MQSTEWMQMNQVKAMTKGSSLSYRHITNQHFAIRRVGHHWPLVNCSGVHEHVFFNTHHLDGEYSWVLQSWKTIKQVNTVGYSIQLISNWYKLMNSWVKYTQFPVATAPIENCLSVSCRWGEHGNSCLPVTWSGIIETVWHPQNSSRLDRAIQAVFFWWVFFHCRWVSFPN